MTPDEDYPTDSQPPRSGGYYTPYNPPRNARSSRYGGSQRPPSEGGYEEPAATRRQESPLRPPLRERMSAYHEEEPALEEDPFPRRAPAGGGMAAFIDSFRRSPVKLGYVATGLAALLVVVCGIWAFVGSHGGGVPVFEPPVEVVKAKPKNPGGMVMSDVSAGSLDMSGRPALAPAPEQARPDALRQEYGGGGSASAPAPAQPAPAAQAPSAPADAGRPAGSAEGGAQSPDSAAREEQPASDAAPAAPAVRHEPRHSDSAKAARKKKEAKAAAAAKEASKAAAPAKKSGAYAVQLAALGSEDAARKFWKTLRQKHGNLLAGYRPATVKVEVNGHTVYRLRLRGFTAAADTKAFCQKAKRAGLACTPASF